MITVYKYKDLYEACGNLDLGEPEITILFKPKRKK